MECMREGAEGRGYAQETRVHQWQLRSMSERVSPKHPVADTPADWAQVPGQTFVRGADNRLWDQAPTHRVRISQGFRIAAKPVTVADFRQFRPRQKVRDIDGIATGISWHDAVAYCRWLSRRTGRPFRLPTEAEWELVFRTDGQYGVRSAPSGVREWCLDDYGDYPRGEITDPTGRSGGTCKVVRGGPLDPVDTAGTLLPAAWYAEPTYRAGMPASFGMVPVIDSTPKRFPAPGWIGIWYGSSDFARPQEIDTLPSGDFDWRGGAMRGGDWSAEYRGQLVPTATGPTVFRLETDRQAQLWVGGRLVADSNDPKASAPLDLMGGKPVDVRVRYSHAGGRTFLRMVWERPSGLKEPIPAAAMRHSAADREAVSVLAPAVDMPPGAHAIGFRVVEAPMPTTKPLPPVAEFHQVGVVPVHRSVKQAGNPQIPWFRRRAALPTPLETSTDPKFQREIDNAGFHPSMRGHNHSPALEVCDNGDVLAVWYTSWHEYEAEVSLIASRLRRGADQWDFPSRILDLPGANDHAPLLWNDRGVVRLFWGSPRLAGGGFPFQWVESTDHGTTWGPVRFPTFATPIGPHSRQPINTAFRTQDGTWWLASDAVGGSSVFWKSADNGRTWSDPGGRTAGRHTVGAALSGGRVLALGGKNTDIDGWMPQALTSDGGKTWTVERTHFPAQGGNQRPSLLRLQSGRLFFAADFQRQGGLRPRGETRAGSYVALSEDDGRTWVVKPLPGVLAHEVGPEFFKGLNGAGTVGYSVARQAPDDTIHLLATMTRPGLHFEMNEAWILDPDAHPTVKDVPAGALSLGPDDRRLRPAVNAVEESTVVKVRGSGRMGSPKGRYGLATGKDGRVWRHGPEEWFHADGRKQFDGRWDFGLRVGMERWWAEDGTLLRERDHRPDGVTVQTVFDGWGKPRNVSRWRDCWKID